MDGSTTGGVARRGTPLITDSFQYPIEGFTDVGERSAIVIPLIADGAVLGVIAVARQPQQVPFGNDYLDLVSDFARHAAIALALAAGREHALNQELAQADTVEDALHAAAEELRRLWRARRVLAVTFTTPGETGNGTPHVVSVGETAKWVDLPSHTRRMLSELRGRQVSRFSIPRGCSWSGSTWLSSGRSPSRTRPCSPCWQGASARVCSGCTRSTSSAKPP
jgi:hypothetical protein